MMKLLLLAISLAASACAVAPADVQPVTAVPACSVSESDRAWLDRALEAWRFTSREITGIERMPSFRAIFFNADCVLTSDNALSANAVGVHWTASRHAGEVVLPGGRRIPAGVTSFASGEKDSYFFVMSTPSVWEAGGVDEGDSLKRTMVAVLLHEGSHIAQLAPYGPRLGALIDRYSLPDSFSDDTMQERFQSNPEFTDSVKSETELFLQAAAANDDAEAKRLAREGLRLLRERQARWLVGADAYFVEAEDVWLTFEGAAQWAAYQWQIHPQGEGVNPAEVMARFTRGRWWSQTEGFAVVMALDRIAGAEWKRHAFGDGAQTVLEMLERAVKQT